MSLFRRHPRLSSLLVGCVAASSIAAGRIAYLELHRQVSTGEPVPRCGWTGPPPVWSSAGEWGTSVTLGWVAGGPLACLCLLWWTTAEPRAEDIAGDEDAE